MALNFISVTSTVAWCELGVAQQELQRYQEKNFENEKFEHTEAFTKRIQNGMTFPRNPM